MQRVLDLLWSPCRVRRVTELAFLLYRILPQFRRQPDRLELRSAFPVLDSTRHREAVMCCLTAPLSQSILGQPLPSRSRSPQEQVLGNCRFPPRLATIAI